jgi:hypothetical protein
MSMGFLLFLKQSRLFRFWFFHASAVLLVRSPKLFAIRTIDKMRDEPVVGEPMHRDIVFLRRPKPFDPSGTCATHSRTEKAIAGALELELSLRIADRSLLRVNGMARTMIDAVAFRRRARPAHERVASNRIGADGLGDRVIALERRGVAAKLALLSA